MSRYDYSNEKYAHYEALFDPNSSEPLHGPRKPKPPYSPKKSQHALVEELTDSAELHENFVTTYQPARHETEWLISSLYDFYDQELIHDVLSRVKGGKEASVYCCAAHPTTGLALVAAKVYRPRKFRNLRNDKLYREGRNVLTAEGGAVKNNDHRTMRALGKKSAFGVQVQHTSWLMHEFTTLQRLYDAGAAVPQPIAASDNAILMGYVGSATRAASTLNEVSLTPEEAGPLFAETLRNIELLLQHGLIHGDLSAYNILYWEGRVTLIDFPQITDSRTNSSALPILQRDIERVCEYFARQGVPSDPDSLVADLWRRYNPLDSATRAADLSKLIEWDEETADDVMM